MSLLFYANFEKYDTKEKWEIDFWSVPIGSRIFPANLEFYKKICENLSTKNCVISYKTTAQICLHVAFESDNFCIWCGLKNCRSKHIDLELLALLGNKTQWIVMGKNVLFSKKQHSTGWQYVLKDNIAFCLTGPPEDRKSNYHIWRLPEQILKIILPWSEVQPLSTWVVHSLWMHNCNWNVIYKMLPPRLCKQYNFPDIECIQLWNTYQLTMALRIQSGRFQLYQAAHQHTPLGYTARDKINFWTQKTKKTFTRKERLDAHLYNIWYPWQVNDWQAAYVAALTSPIGNLQLYINGN